MRYVTSLLKSAFVIIAAIGAIEFLMSVFHPSPAAFARPSEIFQALPRFFLIHSGLANSLATIWRTCVAILLAVPIGVVMGLVFAKVSIIRREGEFALDFLRSIPATALVPLFLVIFGPYNASKYAVGAFTGSLAIAISIVIAYRNMPRDRISVMNLLGIYGIQRIALCELPSIIPSLFVGLRTAASLCLILVVVSEMFIGSQDGLGRAITDLRYSDDVPSLYVAILLTGAIGYILNALLSVGERAVVNYLGGSTD